ncbi:MAG: dTMP kinase [Thermodesulfobacteriota bacterium]
MFITFEGIEGSGKTSQIRPITEFLEERGLRCKTTREPGGTDIGRSIRAILLNPACKELDPMGELLLYEADRIQHVREVIRPALAEGKIVLCDRFFDATVAYQGYARGLDIHLINAVHRLVMGDIRPDLTFLFDLPVETGLSRVWNDIKTGVRLKSELRFEEEVLQFHQKVRAGYLELARQEPERIKIIDAASDRDQVSAQLTAILSGIVWNKEKKRK